jgi:hypothetical protein
MRQTLENIESVLLSEMAISYSFVGRYDDFVPEDLPAICIEPRNNASILDDTLGFNYDKNDEVTVHYVELAPSDRDQRMFVSNVDQMVAVLQNDPKLSGEFNMGIEIHVAYGKRSTEDNVEFIAELTIEGRNV